MTNSVTIGKNTEDAAKDYLQKQGLEFVTKNYHCRQGEIDLVMKDTNNLVFVEVKYRSNNNYGSGFEVVSRKKQQKIIYAARHFLNHYHLEEKVICRFDVVSISPETGSYCSSKNFTWLKNAFY